MAVSEPDTNRRLLPRWRTATETTKLGELASPNTRQVILPAHVRIQIEQLTEIWRFEKTFENAMELVACAVVLGNHSKVVKDAASFIVDAGNECMPALREVAERILSGHTPPPISEWTKQPDIIYYRQQIVQLKSRVRTTPRDAISWVEMARIYTLLGQLDSARRCVEVAISLAPNNRFTLRVAARFYVHLNQTEKGVFLLRRARVTPHDPWLLAAEISLSSIIDKPSKFRKRSFDVIESNQWAPWHTSELNGSLATFLAYDGNVKKARKLFKHSIRDPNENTLAQAQWAAIRNYGNPVPPNLLNDSKAYEALAMYFQEEQKWQEAIESYNKWSIMEPTSSRPLLNGAFTALVALEDGKQAINFLKKAEVLVSNDPTVFNNMAIAYAYCGKLDDAQRELIHAENIYKRTHNSLELSLSMLTATKGLLAYRNGRIEEARNLYLEAVGIADNNIKQKTLILWHMLREEAKVNPSEVRDVLQILYKKTEFIRKEIKELESLHNLIQIDISGEKQPSSPDSKFSVEIIRKAFR